MEQDHRVTALLQEGEEDDAGIIRMKIPKRNLLRMKKEFMALAMDVNLETAIEAGVEAINSEEWAEVSEGNKSLII